MRLIKFKRASWVAVMAMLALPGAMITSCSKENPTENVVPKGDKLTISVLGINDGNSPNQSDKKASNTRTSFAGLSDANAPTIYEFADADVALSIGNSLPAKKSKQAISARFPSGLANSGLKAAEEMTSGVRYVVYIYDGTTKVASAELSAGEAGTIEGLDATGSYTWVALSYNSEEVAPTLDPDAGSVDLPENTDVLYASGTVDLATDPNIGVLFNHAFSRIGIELNTIGVFGTMVGAPPVSVSGLNLATGNIDLLSGEITPNTTTYTPTALNFENVDPNYDDAKIAYVYTAATDNLDLTIEVANGGLAISHVDGELPRTYFEAGANFVTSITPELGMNHHVLLNVVESALETAGGVQWGRSNLFYRGDNGGLRDYAFYATNEATSRADGYFSYGGVVPLQFPTEETSGDPCELVYPLGVWRQPTDTEVSELTSSQGLLGDVLGLIGSLLGASDPAPGSTVGDEYVQYNVNSESPVFDASSNNLRFYYNGQITNTSLLSAIGTNGEGLLGLGLSDLSVDLAGNSLLDLGIEGPGIGLPVLQLPILGDSYGEQAAFWSGTGAISIPILANVGSWGYAAFTTRAAVLGVPVGPEFVKATTTAELLSNVDLLGIDLLNTSLKNVRCVRN